MSLMAKLRALFTPRDMTEGAPWRRIAEFAFPMLVGNFVQQLYSTVDAVVVGRSKWGYEGLAAVGNALPIVNLLLALFVGISTGAGILVSQYFGAKDREKLSRTIGNCITIGAIATVVIMIAGPLLTGPLLTVMDTLPEMFDASKAYLDITFIGIAGFFFYNIFSGVLRGLGDSFSALLYLFVCAVLNVIGDLLLVNSMGVAGVAWATVIAQVISAVLCFVKLKQLKGVFDLRVQELRPMKQYIWDIIRLGIPSGLTQAIFSCAMLLTQALVNSFNDAMFVACNVMVMRVDGYAMLPNFSFGQAMGTYAGQNVGAKKLDRVYQGTKQGTIMSLVTALVLTPLILLCGPALMRLFTPDNEQLVSMAMGMMYILAAGYVGMGVTQCLSGVMRGAGDTTTPMWLSIITTVIVRVPLAYGLVYLVKHLDGPVLLQQRMMFVSLLTAWLIGVVLHVVAYFRGGWKKKQIRAIEAELQAQE